MIITPDRRSQTWDRVRHTKNAEWNLQRSDSHLSEGPDLECRGEVRRSIIAHQLMKMSLTSIVPIVRPLSPCNPKHGCLLRAHHAVICSSLKIALMSRVGAYYHTASSHGADEARALDKPWCFGCQDTTPFSHTLYQPARSVTACRRTWGSLCLETQTAPFS